MEKSRKVGRRCFVIGLALAEISEISLAVCEQRKKKKKQNDRDFRTYHIVHNGQGKEVLPSLLFFFFYLQSVVSEWETEGSSYW